MCRIFTFLLRLFTISRSTKFWDLNLSVSLSRSFSSAFQVNCLNFFIVFAKCSPTLVKFSTAVGEVERYFQELVKSRIELTFRGKPTQDFNVEIEVLQSFQQIR